MKLYPDFSYLLIILLLFFSNNIIAQEEEIIEEEIIETEAISYEKQEINISQLARILNSGDKEVIISDYEITSTGEDNEYLIDKVFFSLYQIDIKNRSTEKIFFYNCRFNLSNNSPLVFSSFKLSRLNIVGCEFVSPIGFEDFSQIGRYPTLIENCEFKDEVTFLSDSLENGNFIFKNDIFHSSLSLEADFNSLNFIKNSFLADSSKFSLRDSEKTHYQLNMSNNIFDDVRLRKNIFNSNGFDNVYSINFQSALFDELTIDSNSIQTINLTGAAVEKTLLIDSLFVTDYIGILNFDFPDKNTNASWHNLGGEKFAIFDKENSGLIVPYQATTEEQLSNTLMYNDLMSSYNKFNSLYHDRGDITSANASYIEIKDIETRKQAYVQSVNPTLNNLINYKLNVFLRFFSDYATNPGKSLIQSLWVLGIFTLLYMISFSRWDGMSYKFHLSQFNIFSKYISSSNSIDDIIAEERKEQADENEDLKDIRDLMEAYRERHKKIPRILKLVGEPIYFLGRFRYDIIPGMIKVVNFQPKSWHKLNTSEKVKSGLLIFLISIVYLIYILIVKLFSSIMLSLNSFVVIGFGALPEEDRSIAMYLTIIEGIIGWFLLTIFTITLFSQVLQNA